MRLADDLACAELVDLVTDYLEGALSPHDRTRFEEHLVFCEGCTDYVEQLRTTIGLTARLRDDDGLAAETCDALLDAFREWKRR
jgi:predicted anti-sigma-YlaC factor YlaD